MLSPTTIFRYKLALIRAAEAGGYLVPGTRAYRLVGGVKVAVLLLGKQARATLAEYQRHHGLTPSGILDEQTRASLIPPDLRAGIVKWARWGVTNTAQIHYSQGVMRMNAVKKPGTLPLYTDCSAFSTLCYSWAGAPDPNGLSYNGTGYTGTLLEHGIPVVLSAARPGDLIFYGDGTAHHVVIVMVSGDDPWCISHGGESGPLMIRHSVEAASQAADGHTSVRVRSYLP